MTITLEQWKASLARGAANAGDKLLEKFESNADLAVTKLKDPQTAETWQKNVSSAEAKANFRGKTKNLQTSDLVEPMREKGIANYQNSMSSESVLNKAAKGVEPYVPIWDEAKKIKKPVVTDNDAFENMKNNMLLFKNKKRSLNK